jgi:hypothetical protein
MYALVCPKSPWPVEVDIQPLGVVDLHGKLGASEARGVKLAYVWSVVLLGDEVIDRQDLHLGRTANLDAYHCF